LPELFAKRYAIEVESGHLGKKMPPIAGYNHYFSPKVAPAANERQCLLAKVLPVDTKSKVFIGKWSLRLVQR